MSLLLPQKNAVPAINDNKPGGFCKGLRGPFDQGRQLQSSGKKIFPLSSGNAVLCPVLPPRVNLTRLTGACARKENAASRVILVNPVRAFSALWYIDAGDAFCAWIS